MLPGEHAQSQRGQLAVAGHIAFHSSAGDAGGHTTTGVKVGNDRAVGAQHLSVHIHVQATLRVVESDLHLDSVEWGLERGRLVGGQLIRS